MRSISRQAKQSFFRVKATPAVSFTDCSALLSLSAPSAVLRYPSARARVRAQLATQMPWCPYLGKTAEYEKTPDKFSIAAPKVMSARNHPRIEMKIAQNLPNLKARGTARCAECKAQPAGL